MMAYSLCKFLLGFFCMLQSPVCVYGHLLRTTCLMLSGAMYLNVISTAHRMKQGREGGRKDGGRKEGSKNGNPPIYVMRIIAASVSCSRGKVREGGKSRDWKIIRVASTSSSMSWPPFQEKREFHRTCYRCCSTVTQKCSMH